MGTLIAIGLVVLSVWIIKRVVRLFDARSAGRGWWTLLALAWLAGAGLGVRLTFFFEYQYSDRIRIAGFPLPIVFFVREGDQWTDFVTRDYYALPAVAANVCTVTAALVTPLLALFVLLHPRRKVQPCPAE